MVVMTQNRARVRIGTGFHHAMPATSGGECHNRRRPPRSEIAIFGADVSSIALDVWRLNAAPGRRIRSSDLVAVRAFWRLHASASRSESPLAHTSFSGCGERDPDHHYPK